MKNILIIGCAGLAACATADGEWSDADEAAYQTCLQENMAAAVAWEMIEESCRKQVAGEDDPSPEFRLK